MGGGHFLVVFDFDGPVFDARRAGARALEETAVKLGLGAARLAFAHLPLLEPESLIAACYPALDTKRRSDAVTVYRQKLADEEKVIRLDEDVREALRSLCEKGTSLAVHSTRPAAELQQKLVDLKLEASFRVVVAAETPEPRLEHIARECSVEPSALVFIGNSALDRSAAKEAGATYYHAGWTGEPTVLDAEAVVLDHPRRLLELVDALQIRPTIRAKTDVPEDLRDAADSGNLVFCAGAGVSRDSGIGTWKEHYSGVFERLRAVGLTKALDPVDALQLVCSDKQGARAVFDAFKSSFQKDAEPNRYHYALLRSGAPRIWTLNYDTLFEKAAVVAPRVTVVRNDADLQHQFRERQLVIKMNGDFESARYHDDLEWGVVFLRQQFDLIERHRVEIWRAFEDDFRSSCILFVGLSFDDPGLRRIASVARAKIPRTRHPHYLLAHLPSDPIGRATAYWHAKNLERLDIQTLFFETYPEITAFVENVCLAAIRPIVGLAGSAFKLDEPGGGDPSRHLPDGKFDVATISKCAEQLGRNLALHEFRVTSGGAPAVGIPFVSAAFEQAPKLARFYVRRKDQRFFPRLAPIIVVNDERLEAMREVLIGEMHTLVAIAGSAHKGDESGVVHEIELALKKQIPVVLIPQAGGTVGKRYEELRLKIRDAYCDKKLRDAVCKLNDEVKATAPENLPDFCGRMLPGRIRDVLRVYAGGSSPIRHAAESW